jgi:hypothetical protein
VARRGGVWLPPTCAGEVLDARAREEYRRRIEDLRDEIEEAERFGDLGRMGRARTQVQLVARELERAVGLGGRSRVVGSWSERARVNVTRAVKAAIRSISSGMDAISTAETPSSSSRFASHEPFVFRMSPATSSFPIVRMTAEPTASEYRNR